MISAYPHRPAQNDCRGSHWVVQAGKLSCQPYFSNTAKEHYMSKNHYSTKPKRRNRSGKRKDTRRIAANMAKIKDLERSSAHTK
jgi:hypothetical protein